MSDYVSIASKLPNDLILYIWEPIPGTNKSRHKQESYTVHGTKGAREMSNGYALTPNIPRQFWEEWLSQNSNSEIVRTMLVFAYPPPVARG